MTSLFFVMLVLFVLAISLQHGVVVATREQLRKIQELEKSIENIDSNYFVYFDEYKRHTLKDVNVSFRVNSSDITDISLTDRKKLLNAGKAIQAFLRSAQTNNKGAEYMLIIEGQSSKDNYVRNYELSYERALSLVKYWERNGIIFDNLPCELIISGSGQASKFRNKPDVRTNYSNQRFVIHIIPKPGIIEHLDKYE
jgi:outer membrane protein OmpA-like peptidoglycan-associated protein